MVCIFAWRTRGRCPAGGTDAVSGNLQGNEVDVHNVHWHGLVLNYDGSNVDQVLGCPQRGCTIHDMQLHKHRSHCCPRYRRITLCSSNLKVNQPQISMLFVCRSSICSPEKCTRQS